MIKLHSVVLYINKCCYICIIKIFSKYIPLALPIYKKIGVELKDVGFC